MSLQSFLTHWLRGFCMGSADVVPGVSGGTMAYILGIYGRLVTAISRFDVQLGKHLAHRRWGEAIRHIDGVFLFALGLGILGALLFFTRVVPIPQYLQSHPEPIYGLFFGLVVGSLVLFSRQLGRHRGGDWVMLAAGTMAGWLVVTAIPVQTPDTWWFVFLAGSLAICAMLLPGISGSFVLLILHQYETVFGAVGRFDFTVLIPFAAGCAFGALCFSRLLSWLLHHYQRGVSLFINGVLLASLWVIWPFQRRLYTETDSGRELVSSTPYVPDGTQDYFLVSLAAVLIGLCLIFILAALAGRRRISGPGSAS